MGAIAIFPIQKHHLSIQKNLIGILVSAEVLLASLNIVHAQSPSLLPSQDNPDLFSVKICQDRQVLSIIASSASAMLKTKVVIANGMQADDIHLDGVYVNERVVYCSMTMAANRVTDTVRYIIGSKDNSYLILLGGNKGSKLFPKEISLEPLPSM
jgi:NADH:ubiquinone oxidoreductase subunit K